MLLDDRMVGPLGPFRETRSTTLVSRHSPIPSIERSWPMSTHILLISALLAASAKAAQLDLPAPPTSLEEILELGKLTVTTGILGGALILAGLLLCFAGKRFFKLFLSLVGLSAGAVAGFIGMAFLNGLVTIPNALTVTYIVACITGLVVAAACLYMWKLGVYVGAGLGGYSAVIYILSLKVGGLIENQIGRQAALLIGVGLGVIGAMFLEDIAIAVASSMIGSLTAIYGVDCYANQGFRQQLRDQAMSRKITLPTINTPLYFMFAATIALAVCGIVVQLLHPSKGYGRSG